MSTDPLIPKNNQWLRYAGLATQLLAMIGLSIWLGIWLDGKINTSFPWFSLFLPVLVVVGMLVQVMKDTRPGNKK